MTEFALTLERWRASNATTNVSMHGAVHSDLNLEFDDYIAMMSELGLEECATVLGRVKMSYMNQGHPGQTPEHLEELLTDFRNRLYDALKRPRFLVLNARERSLFEPGAPHFGADVPVKFDSISYDIDEAGKCLALGRGTASVFHSLRCLEATIRAISRSLKIPDPTKGPDRSWANALRKIKEEMDRRWPPSGRLSGDGRLFEDIYAALAAIQNPWRNATMHLDQKYTEEEAKHIFEVVGGLIRKVASRLNEDGHPLA
ncbi:hypothetical protein G6M50_27750 [Agrobacterium rhizogenes]|nr:hypothetical protein [Rhizobium rhizogenes]NTJ81587.1 hypothetical protein [Rhizobium rhizogenes]